MLQRLARAGWRVVALDAGPVLGPGRRLGQRRGRLAPPVLDRAPGHLRARSGAAGLEQLRPRRRRVDGALRRLHARGSTPATSTPTRRDGVGADWPIDYADLQALLRGRSRRSCPSPARTGRGATRTATRTGRTRSAATARSSCAAPTRLGHHGQGRSGGDRQRPVRQPAALHLPRLLPAGLQGQRQGLAADHPHPGRPRARRRGPRRRDGHPDRDRRAHRPRHRACTTSATASRTSSGPRMVAVAGYSIETPRLLLNSASRPLPRRAVQRLRPGRPLPHGAGRAADRGPVRRRGPDVQGAAARGQHRGSSTRPTRPSPTSAGSPSRPSHRCRSPGPSTSPRRATGAPRCAST